MPGKRPRPLLQSSLVSGDGCVSETVNAQVSGKHPCPSSSVPHHIVLGFDIEQEIKPYDVCESPRSVLDANALPSEKQATGRSLRSWLHTLPLRNKGSQGVGLAIIVDIQAEEEEGNCLLSHVRQHTTSPCLQSPHHQRSQPIAIVANPCARVQTSAKKVAKKVNECVDLSPSHSQTKVMSSEDSIFDFFGSDEMSPWQECVLHNQRSQEAEIDEDYVIPPPIFSVASVPSNYCGFDIRSMSFLDACAFCQRAFLPGKDIYMYRGDQAFCSAECRGKQIKIDESKEKQVVMVSSPDHHALLGYANTPSHKLGKIRGM